MNKPFYYRTLLSALLVGVAPAAVAEDSSELTDVVVTAASYEQDVRDASAAVTIITREDLQERPVADVLEAIRESVGLSLQSQGGGSNRPSLSIRGMDSDRSLILIDGRRINASDNVLQHTDFQFDWIPIEQIERIEIVRGPMSALYGSEAFGGVVNIITKSPTTAWNRSFNVQSGAVTDNDGENQFNAGISVSGPLIKDKLGLKFSLSMFNRNEQGEDDAVDAPLRESKQNVSGSVGLVFTPSKGHKIDVEVLRTDEPRTSSDEDGELITDILREHYSIGYSAQLGKFDTQLRAYQSDITKDRSNNENSEGQKDRVVDGKVNFALGEMQHITVGAEYHEHSHIGIDKYSIGGMATNDSTAAYMQDEVFLGDNTILTLGGRFDSNSQYGSEFSPRAYLVYHYSDNLTFRGGYGHGFKAPQLKYTTEGYITGRPGYILIANPDLKPETIDTYEFGLNWVEEGMRFSTNFFNNDITDLIESETLKPYDRETGELGESTYINIASATIKGLETTFEKDLSHGFGLTINHTYLDAMNESDDEYLNHRPEHVVNTTLSWKGKQGWAWKLRANYTGKQYASNGDYRNPQQLELPSFTLWNISFTKQLDKNVRLLGGIENFTNVDLYDKSDFYSYIERGRYVYFGLQGNF
ncbi:TonB-dependent receptor [Thiomicrorhabdus sp. 6S2-11]|uniref:TonB-dependent receptor n=1 Tax=Thiomicrorhabdus marina TaxID=2818442 RepID=A0ABS3Q4S5_9GAMM|nr:TonB-dependent receptor [Thiomicrorhabdus marina]MBO1927328.1 TonB-dependent receptor [Thiomicrorhabdus marina]